MGTGMFHRHKYTSLVVIAGLIILADQATKAVVLSRLQTHESIPVISGFFNLTHIQNPGGAFGLLADRPSALRRAFFLVVSLLALGMVVHFYRTTPRTHPVLALGFALIVGGAVGNMIDRVRFGKVVDFLDLYIGTYHWPAFNVADSAITVGIAIFVIHLVLRKLPG